jgi:HPt (histidine-containing phosphotransfer) domain-containing protein
MERPDASPVVDAADDRFDEEILDELFEVMGDSGSVGLVKACELFLAGVPTRFAEIEAALAEGRLEDAAQGAHSMRGSAGAFGARRLSVLTLTLERLCREGDRAGAAGLLGEMQTEFRIFRAILVARLGRLSG